MVLQPENSNIICNMFEIDDTAASKLQLYL